jgi:hypothetical protein
MDLQKDLVNSMFVSLSASLFLSMSMSVSISVSVSMSLSLSLCLSSCPCQLLYGAVDIFVRDGNYLAIPRVPTGSAETLRVSDMI